MTWKLGSLIMNSRHSQFTHHMAAIPYDDPKWEEWLRELLPEKKRLGREHVPLALTYAGQVRGRGGEGYCKQQLASNSISAIRLPKS